MDIALDQAGRERVAEIVWTKVFDAGAPARRGKALLDGFHWLPVLTEEPAPRRHVTAEHLEDTLCSLVGGLNTLSTMVDVTEIYPYLKKYEVPYRSGRNNERLAHRLHKDYVMSYILPIRYARINRIEVLLGGKAEPTPPPPTYNQMMRISSPPETVLPNVNVEELKDIVGQAIKARLFNERERMRALLADDFVYGFYQGKISKVFFLNGMTGDQSVRGFEITHAELSFKGAAPALAATVKYQSLAGEKFKSYNYVFTFVKQNNQWLIQTWKPA